jgi:hypothetical protein
MIEAEVKARKWRELRFFEGHAVRERWEALAVGELADDLL